MTREMIGDDPFPFGIKANQAMLDTLTGYSHEQGLTLREAAAQQPKWVEPDTYIPSDSNQFKQLAREIIGSHTRVRVSSSKNHVVAQSARHVSCVGAQ